MERLNFSVDINAPREKVWEVLWDDSTYGEWTAVFGEGSYAETDNWREGSKVKFLAQNGEGMLSQISANRPNEFMSFEHLGMIKDGVEDTDSEEVKKWSGAIESYTLQGNNGSTTLNIEMDMSPEHKEYFEKAWPKALDRVKALSEQKI